MRPIAGIVTLILISAAGAAVAAGGDGKHAGKRLDAMFERLDLNKDGAIDKGEIAASRETRFTTSDTNADGLLTEAEIMAAAKGRAERRVKRMLSRLDRDGDGAISRVEYDKRASKRGDRMFERLDANGDGKVTREEARTARREGRLHKRHRHSEGETRKQ